MRVAAIIPVKNPSTAKVRLSKILTQNLREKLTIEMVKDIVVSVSSCKLINYIVIVSPEEKLKAIREHVKNVFFVKDEGIGQINAVIKGIEYAKNILKVDVVIILVADAPLIKPWDLCAIVKKGYLWNYVVLAPSDDGGTNVILQNPPRNIPLRYGRNSFHKHLSECRKRKLKYSIYRSENTLLDVDVPDDLEKLRKLGEGTFTYAFIKEVFGN